MRLSLITSAISMFILLFASGCQKPNFLEIQEVGPDWVKFKVHDTRVAANTGFTMCYKKKANVCAMCVTGPKGNCVGGIQITGPDNSGNTTWQLGGLDMNTTYRLRAKNSNGTPVGQIEEFTTTN